MMRRLLVICIAFSMTRCMKVPALENNDGALATPTEIYSKFVWAWGEDPAKKDFRDKFDGAEINLNEIVSLSKTVEIIGSAPREYEQQSMKMHTVLNTIGQDGLPKNEFRMAIVTALNSGGTTQKPIFTEYGYLFDKASTLSGANATSAKQDIIKSLSQVHSLGGEAPNLGVHNMVGYLLACAPEPQSNWFPSCYNLRAWTSLEPAPVFLRNETGCGGLVNCQMNVRHVAYDLVTDVNDEKTGSRLRMKTLIHLQMSPDVPYLSRLTSLCFQGLGKYEDIPYVATVCTDVTRFERGTPR